MCPVTSELRTSAQSSVRINVHQGEMAIQKLLTFIKSRVFSICWKDEESYNFKGVQEKCALDVYKKKDEKVERARKGRMLELRSYLIALESCK